LSSLRDSPDDFEGAIGRAAEQLGLAPLFVEKDYWVTQVLSALHSCRPGGFVFKGGTSLSKGYALIERFSEDVDILIQPAKGDSARARENLLAELALDVANRLGLNRHEARPPGRGRSPHRADILIYPRLIKGGPAVPLEDRGVLLETGYAGGEWPAEMVTLCPLLCEPLGIGPGEFDDTDPFDVRALHPARTLVEKLSLLHHVATRFAEDAVPSDDRFGRHYYDIYKLLDDSAVRKALEDRPQFARILDDMQVVSARHYGGWTDRPEEGYAASLAFSAERGSELRHWLEDRYGDAAGLMPASVSGSWPSFGQVVKRVQDHRDLL
jgi:hypothetical protein